MFGRLFLNSSRNAAPLALGLFVTVKDLLGIEKIVLDKDPIKDKIKQSMLHRKQKRHDEAIAVLNDALKDAQDTKCEEYISRVYDELANTYYQMENLEMAERIFRELIARMVRLHNKNEESPEFIGISLKLADIYARKGDLQTAEVGLKHCVSKQMKVMDNHLNKYLVSKGAIVQSFHPVEEHGDKYTDPIVLFAMALEQYAYFLLDYHEDKRLDEVSEYMDEVLKISYEVYGAHHPHHIVVLNNIGTKCLQKERYELAKKYLEVGINRILLINECGPMIVAFYCAYAEALFHSGEREKALEFALKAERLSRDQEASIKEYAVTFLQQLENDARSYGVTRKKVKEKAGASGEAVEEDSSNASWWRSWIPI